MTPDELSTYDRLLSWFLWTWLGQGAYVRRPRITLEQALRLAREAHRQHYPHRRPLREHELALAWLATDLRDEPRRVEAMWWSERSDTEVDLHVWASLGPGRRVAIGLGTRGGEKPGTGREILLEPGAAWALLRQLLATVGRAREPREDGVRSDTVMMPPINGRTWDDP